MRLPHLIPTSFILGRAKASRKRATLLFPVPAYIVRTTEATRGGTWGFLILGTSVKSQYIQQILTLRLSPFWGIFGPPTQTVACSEPKTVERRGSTFFMSMSVLARMMLSGPTTIQTLFTHPPGRISQESTVPEARSIKALMAVSVGESGTMDCLKATQSGGLAWQFRIPIQTRFMHLSTTENESKRVRRKSSKVMMVARPGS